MRLRAALVVVGLLVAGCGKTVADEDCVKVRDKMTEVWASESKKAAPSDGPLVEKAGGVIKAEGTRLASDWMAECKKDLVGKRVDPREIDCLLGAKSIAEINKCAEP